LLGSGENPCRIRSLTIYVAQNGHKAHASDFTVKWVYDLPRNVEPINPILDAFQHLYNHHRPHGALGWLAPAQDLAKLKAKDTSPSQRST